MRIVLVTGKGGVGKTTVAAATAIAAADHGYRTLVASTDPAHSLADALDVPLGDRPREVVPGLLGQQVDAQEQLERQWGTIRRQLMAVFDWGGVTGIEAEEFLVFPGMDELFALLEVKEHARSGHYDAVVVDCAPTAETLRLAVAPRGALLVLRPGSPHRAAHPPGRPACPQPDDQHPGAGRRGVQRR